jgi:hypothetical protein
MDPPVEEKQLSNGLDTAKQEREESPTNSELKVPTTRSSPREPAADEQEVQSTHTDYGGGIEEPISVSCAARCSHNS